MTGAVLALAAENPSGLQFASDVIGHLAWPVVVLIVVVVLRQQLSAMLGALTARTRDLTHLEAGPVKADFGQGLNKVDDELQQAVEKGRRQVTDGRQTRGGSQPGDIRVPAAQRSPR